VIEKRNIDIGKELDKMKRKKKNRDNLREG